MHLKRNTLFIIPNNMKNKFIFSLSNNLHNIKVTTFNEIRDNLYFMYDEKAIYFLMKKYNLKFDNAKIILDNLYYIKDKIYNIEKLDNLVKIKKELLSENLLIYNSLYKTYLKDKIIKIYGYIKLNRYEINIVEDLKQITDVEILKNDSNEYLVNKCYEFETMIDEVSFIAEKISNLISNNVNINDIAILNVTNEYSEILSLVFKLYNIPIEKMNENYLYGTNTSKLFLKELKEKGLHSAINSIKTSNLYAQFLKICNKYIWCKDKYIYDLIVHELKITNIETHKYLNSIKLNKESKYNFLLGFNSNYPNIIKDEDYLSDEYKKLLGYDTSKDINIITKENSVSYLKGLTNLTITYSLKSFNSNFFKCSLIDELNIEVIKKHTLVSKYSNKINKLNLTNYLDLYTKYGYKSDDLNLLYSIYNLNYKSYDNSFKGINNKNLYDLLNNKLLLSYSSINNYYNCKFKYYINDLLKLNIDNNKFYLIIGNLFHYILSIAFNEKFNFDYELEKYLKKLNKNFSNKELFFIDKLVTSLKDVISIINEQKKYTKLDNSLYEKQVYIDKSRDIKITFMGVIDKIMYLKENDSMYGIIIDYKTGNPNTSLDNIKYGIDMQLPIYLYLINKDLKNIKIIGLYYQIINQKYETMEEARNNLKLVGYTIDDEDLIEKIDSTYDNSLFIKSMKKTNNGFSKYTKLLSQDEIEDMINLVDNKIDDAINGILSGDFKINPKKIGDYISCTNCIYSDICFKKESDFVNLEKEVDKIA